MIEIPLSIYDAMLLAVIGAGIIGMASTAIKPEAVSVTP